MFLNFQANRLKEILNKEYKSTKTKDMTFCK